MHIHIKPTDGWKLFSSTELLHYKDLLWFLVVRGVKAKYAQSVLGVGWAIIQPLLSTIIFTVVFGYLAKVESEGVPYFIFNLLGNIPWVYFASTVNDAAGSLVANAGLITKVYFPRLVLPLSTAVAKLIDFFIAFIVALVVLLIFGYKNLLWGIVLLPFFLLILILTSLGIGMWLSALAVQFRDVKHVLSFIIQLLMYLAPIVYPTSNVPTRLHFIYSLNPLVGIIEGFRSAFLMHQPIPWNFILVGSFVSIILFLSGLIYFIKSERKFADII
ncbi:MAG: ABC transporter permease [Flavobacteriales bacterium]|nr:ABC transporter permease [Flavobacteriales bacterium]